MIERPQPDGYVTIRLREPMDTSAYTYDERNNKVYDDKAYEYRIWFYELRPDKGWHEHDTELKFHMYDDLIQVWPKSAMMYYERRGNSDEYLIKLAAFQEQHDHFWVPDLVHLGFGQYGDSDTDFYCGTSKTGELGCGARKSEGVVRYASPGSHCG